jgi:hypothetical protein
VISNANAICTDSSLPDHEGYANVPRRLSSRLPCARDGYSRENKKTGPRDPRETSFSRAAERCGN